jgi:hypothetical protein
MMWRIKMLSSLIIICGFFVAHSVIAGGDKTRENQSNDISTLIGNWNGESICADKKKFPGCNDEQVIYRVVKSADKANTVTITMDKIVNNKPETMGIEDFAYDTQKRILTTEYKNSRVHLVIEFAVKGDLMEGTVTALPDKSLVRRIKLKKEK